ncbi:MAG: hypothetical protein JWQ71_5024 [Pedosphaera sp.]|nr:hypothetical protein [Pedosphaera sp.]
MRVPDATSIHVRFFVRCGIGNALFVEDANQTFGWTITLEAAAKHRGKLIKRWKRCCKPWEIQRSKSISNMDSDYIQFIRYKLQKRLKRINSSEFQSFHFTLVQTWGFLQGNEITKGILDDLERRCPELEAEAEKTLGGAPQVGLSEDENDGICYWVVKKCAALVELDTEINVGHQLSSGSKHNEAVECFRLTYVEPLFDYIDEHIDDKRAVLAVLRKYKHRCEWFRRSELLAACKQDTQKGEKVLAHDLYEYLHDQGLHFHIEPESASGRIDLISSQTGKDRLVADVKIFNPDGGQNAAYLTKGFRQVYDYTKDFNEQFGYLIIFKTCEQDLAISTPRQESCVPFVTHNNKTIFLVIVDIFEYTESASKRGRLKTYDITPEQLIQCDTDKPNALQV